MGTTWSRIFDRMDRRTMPIASLAVLTAVVCLATAAAAQPATPAKPADAAPPPAYVEQEITIPSGALQLPGTLCLPAKRSGKVPLVVMVPGSGPQDRDETIGPNKPFRDIAHGLAAAGIATLRYDRRTRVVPPHSLVPAEITLDWEVTDDAVAALQFAAKLPEADPASLYLLGHSLGGTMAPYIAGRFASLRGVVLLAPGIRPIFEVLHDQAVRLKDQGATEEQLKAVLAIQQTLFDKAKDPNAPGTEVVAGAPLAYWRDWNARRPAEEWKKLRLPVLVLQGGKDVQISKADYDLLAASLPKERGEFHWLANDNHLFMPSSGAGLREYSTAGHVDPEVVSLIAAWVKRQR